MASIYKRAKSNVWQTCFYVKDPDTGELNQVRKSTGTTNQKEAKRIAADLERQAQGVILAESDEARAVEAIITQMKQEIAQSKFTVLSARKHLHEITRIVTGEQLTSFTIESWCNEWLSRKEKKSSKATMARYKGHKKHFIDFLGADKAGKPLETFTATDAERYKQALLAKGVVGKTVLAYTKDVAAIFKAAIREGLISFNPMTAIEAVTTDDSQERKPFTAEEVSQLIAAAPCDEWRGLILAAAYTGLRLGDVARLQWSSIDLQRKMITLMPAKTKRKKREVTIPIHPDLLAYFETVTIANDEPSAPVFPKLSLLRIGDRTGLSQKFIGIMKAAGVSRGKPSKEKAEGTGHVTYERGFHSLRHTFTTWLRTAGVSEEDRMELTGHSTRESHAGYAHADESVLRDAIAKLKTLTESQT